jgi:hypothetical protein
MSFFIGHRKETGNLPRGRPTDFILCLNSLLMWLKVMLREGRRGLRHILLGLEQHFPVD